MWLQRKSFTTTLNSVNKISIFVCKTFLQQLLLSSDDFLKFWNQFWSLLIRILWKISFKNQKLKNWLLFDFSRFFNNHYVFRFIFPFPCSRFQESIFSQFFDIFTWCLKWLIELIIKSIFWAWFKPKIDQSHKNWHHNIWVTRNGI